MVCRRATDHPSTGRGRLLTSGVPWRCCSDGEHKEVLPVPSFIDRHSFSTIPSSVRHQMRLEVRQQMQDARGVRPTAHWCGDGVIYCILDAPDADAACQHHADRGLPCDDLHTIEELDGRAPISDEHQARVRRVIRGLCQSESVPRFWLIQPVLPAGC